MLVAIGVDRGRAVARHRHAGLRLAVRTSFRRCRGCARRRASAICSCSGGGPRRASGLARVRRPAVAAVAAGRAGERRVAARAVHVSTRSTAFLPSTRCCADEPGRSSLAEQPFFPRWAIFQNGALRARLDGALAAADERLQRLHAGDLSAATRDAFWYFPQDWAIQAMKDAGVTHVVVHPAAFHKDHQAVLPVLETRTDFELIGDRRRRHPALSAQAVSLRYSGGMLSVRIHRLDPSVPLPEYQTPGAAGFDLAASADVVDRARHDRAGADGARDRGAGGTLPRDLRAQQHAAQARLDGGQRGRRDRPGLLRADRRSEDPGAQLHRGAGARDAGDRIAQGLFIPVARRHGRRPRAICAMAHAAASVATRVVCRRCRGASVVRQARRMRIYLACTVRGDRGAVAALRSLVASLEAAGHTILTTHLLDDNVEAAEVGAHRARRLRARHRVARGVRPADRGRVGLELRRGLRGGLRARPIGSHGSARRPALPRRSPRSDLAADRRQRASALHGPDVRRPGPIWSSGVARSAGHLA